MMKDARLPDAEWFLAEARKLSVGSDVDEDAVRSLALNARTITRNALASLNTSDPSCSGNGEKVTVEGGSSRDHAPTIGSALEALKAVRGWAGKRCPVGPPDYAPDEPKICPLCLADRDDIVDGFCKAVESTIPRHLLRQMDAALSSAEQVVGKGPGMNPNLLLPEDHRE